MLLAPSSLVQVDHVIRSRLDHHFVLPYGGTVGGTDGSVGRLVVTMFTFAAKDGEKGSSMEVDITEAFS